MKNVDVDLIRFENSVVHINYKDGEEHLWVYSRMNDKTKLKTRRQTSSLIFMQLTKLCFLIFTY